MKKLNVLICALILSTNLAVADIIPVPVDQVWVTINYGDSAMIQLQPGNGGTDNKLIPVTCEFKGKSSSSTSINMKVITIGIEKRGMQGFYGPTFTVPSLVSNNSTFYKFNNVYRTGNDYHGQAIFSPIGNGGNSTTFQIRCWQLPPMSK